MQFNLLKALLLAIIMYVILFPNFVQAQYGNEWISSTGYDKTYYKFKTNHKGLHRIFTATLQENGIPLNGNHFKVFHRGEEIPIYVSTDSTMGENDYLEFYGTPNDGYFDTQMYEEALHQPNPYFSVFEEEGTFFLVIDEAANGLRFQAADNDLSNVPTAETSFRYNSITSAANTFHFGKPIFIDGTTASLTAQFAEGEGYCTSTISYLDIAGTVYNSKKFLVNTEGVNNGTDETAQVKVRVIGKNQSSDVYYDKDFTIAVNGEVFIESFGSDPNTDPDLLLHNYETKDFIFDVPKTILGDSITEISIHVYNGMGNSGFPFETEISVGFAEITYPHTFDFAGKDQFLFETNIAETKYFEIANFDGGTMPIVYDFTSQKRIIPVVENGVLKFKIEADENPNHEIFISSTNENTLANIEDLKARNFQNPNTSGDYILLYNKKLAEDGECADNQIQRYINYRASAAGGNYQVVAYEIEDLYDMFAHGIDKHSMSIKNFVNYAVDNWATAPVMMNIVGKGVQYNISRFYEPAENACLVPSYGHKASDMMLTTRGNDIAPQIAVGRIPARNCEQVRIYLDKLEEYEAIQSSCERENKGWTNDVLQIAKGWYAETDSLLLVLEQQADILTAAPMGMEIVETLSNDSGKISSQPCDNYEVFFEQMYNDQEQVRPHIENGVNLINYLGHSIYQTWQYDIGVPESYDNEGKYPIILSSSAFVGMINEYAICNGEYAPCMSEKWIFADNRGAIGFYGYVGLNSLRRLGEHSTMFLENLNSDAFYGQAIGLSVQQTAISVSEKINNEELEGVDANRLIISTFEMTYCGDPAVKMYSNNTTELSVIESDISVESNLVFPETESSFTINYQFFNGGIAIAENIALLIEQSNTEGTIVYSETVVLENPSNGDTFAFEIPVESDYSGEYTISFTVDTENVVAENCEDDNTGAITVFYEACSAQSAAFSIETETTTATANPQVCIDEPFSVQLLNNTPFVSYDFGTEAVFNEFANGFQVSYPSSGIKNISVSVGSGNCIVTETQQIEVVVPLEIPFVDCGSSTDMLAFQWLNVAGASSYVVSVNGETPIEITESNFVLENVPPNTDYTIEIFAKSEAYPCGNTSETIVETCTTEACDFSSISQFENVSICENEALIFNAEPAGGIYTIIATNESFEYDEPINLSAGNYEIEYAYTSDYCTYTEIINVEIKPEPIIAINGNLEICEGDTTYLNVNVFSGEVTTIEWENSELSGELAVNQAGTYSATATTPNGCSTNVSAEVTYLSAEACTTSIFDNLKYSTVKVYPVPTNQVLTLDFGTNIQNELKIDIFGIDGKLLYTTTKLSNSATFELNIENLPTGVFWLKAENNQAKIFTAKFVKE